MAPLLGLDVDDAIRALRPDFVALALRVSGVENQPGTEDSERWLQQAETAARETVAPHPHVVAWRDAFRAFGAKPQRTASSVDALWQRAAKGQLPHVNWLVDLYNAISVLHALPVGGEDATRFAGTLRLIRASGDEPFETVQDGMPIVEHPEPGEVVWADTIGVTCRRWNWRQGTRTRLTEASSDVLFLLERLEPLPLGALHAAGDALIAAIRERCPGASVERQLLGAVHEAGR
jgi:DNA/RNA-binding domain of Phe-tRNA-synthetase-like protein